MKSLIVAVVLVFQTNVQAAKPLVVLLHGCKQFAEDIVAMTEFDRLAKEKDFFLYTPDQPVWMNPYKCWNWFALNNQTRSSFGEVFSIVEKVRKIQKQYDIDPRQIYAVGFSAGAGLSLNLLYCYPEVFAGAAVHSGPPFAVATNGTEAKNIMRFGSGLSQTELRQRALACSGKAVASFQAKKLLIFQGNDDDIVNFSNAEEVERQFPGKTKFYSIPGLGHNWWNEASGKIINELEISK